LLCKKVRLANLAPFRAMMKAKAGMQPSLRKPQTLPRCPNLDKALWQSDSTPAKQLETTD